MTAFARSPGGGDVGRRHSGRSHTVMALSAIACNTGMVELRTSPAERRVTHVAFEVRGQVLRAFALSLHVVVAGCAASVSLGVIEIDGRYPRNGRMAAITLVRGQNVTRGLCSCAHCRTQPVAGAAFPRRTFEETLRVTLLARQVTVLTGQLEPRREVVELRTLHGCVARWRKQEHPEQRNDREE